MYVTELPLLANTEFLHVKPGKGAAFVRTKLRNCTTGNVVDKTFRAGESVEAATIEKRESQFTYVDGDEVRGVPRYVMLHTGNFEYGVEAPTSERGNHNVDEANSNQMNVACWKRL